MSDYHNVLIWIDHREARVFRFDAEGFDRASVRSAHPDRHVHCEVRPLKTGSTPLSKAFFKRVAQALEEPAAILITGPADTKEELAAFLGQSWPALAARVSSVEKLDHPTNHALVCLARHFFRTDDR